MTRHFFTRRARILAGLTLVLAVSASFGSAQRPAARYRVEEIFRLESATAQPGRANGDPVTTAVEGRARFVLEQQLEDAGPPARGVWRLVEVEVEGPRTEPAEKSDPRVERSLALGLEWLRRQAGQEFRGALVDLPVFPLGEAEPAYLTRWLRWAQTGIFADAVQDPLSFARREASDPLPVVYQVRWLRSEFRQAPCHVQQARWTVPVEAAPRSVTPALAAEGVEARTHFSASSLEWVSQDNPALVYAERSGVRETFWNLEKVEKPELRALVFRLRLSVQVRVARLP